MFSGCYVAIVTPMLSDGSIDYVAFERLMEFQINQKSSGIVVAGTTGESATLDFDEHRALIKKAVELAKGRVPIIAGTGANSTLEALRLTNWAAEAGAQACLLVAPYYNKPSQEGLYQHYKLIAQAVDIPQILYNVPGRCGCDILPATVERLCELSNIVAIKEASTLARVEELVAKVGNRIDILTGEDGSCAEAVLRGAKGVVSVTANVAPLMMHDMIVAALKDDKTTALQINEKLADLHEVLFLEGNPVPVKYALSTMNMIDKGLRLPLVGLSEKFHADVSAALKKAGLI